jgi:hypothetical protein
MDDMSRRTGISVEGMQRLDRQAIDAGVSLNQMTQTISRINQKLGRGGKAWREYGLNVRELQQMNPEEQFRKIVDTIQQLPSKTEKAAAAQKLLGDRTGKTMQIIENYNNQWTSVGQLTEKQIKQNADLQTAWDHFDKSLEEVKMQVGSFFNQLGLGPELITDLGLVLSGLAGYIGSVAEIIPGLIKYLEDAWKWFERINPVAKVFGNTLRSLKGLIRNVAEDAKESGILREQARIERESKAPKPPDPGPSPQVLAARERAAKLQDQAVISAQRLSVLRVSALEEERKITEQHKLKQMQIEATFKSAMAAANKMREIDDQAADSAEAAARKQREISLQEAQHTKDLAVVRKQMEDEAIKRKELERQNAIELALIEKRRAEEKKKADEAEEVRILKQQELEKELARQRGDARTSAGKAAIGTEVNAAKEKLKMEEARQNVIRETLQLRGIAIEWNDKEFQQLASILGLKKDVTEATFDWAGALNIVADMLGPISGGIASAVKGMSGLAASLQKINDSEGGFGGLFKNLTGGAEGGMLDKLSGVLGSAGMIGSMASTAIGIGKTIVGLFKSDPVEKAQEEAGKALGHGVSREMAESIMKEAERTGESIGEAAVRMEKEAREKVLMERQRTRAAGVDRAQQSISGMFNIDEDTGEMSMKIKGAAESQGAIYASTFWAVAGEKGLVVAVDSFKETWDAIKGSIPQEMVDNIESVFNIFAEGSPARDAAEGAKALADNLAGMASAGFLSADAFQDFQNVAKAGYDQVIESGGNAQQAIMSQMPLLANLKRLHEEIGFPLDDNTKKMIEQAEAMGLAFPIDPMLQVVELLREIAKVLGAEIPAAAEKAGESIDKNLPGENGAPSPGGNRERPYGEYATGVENMRMNKDALIGVHAGERVSVVPRGPAAAGKSAGGGEVININYTIAPSVESDPLASAEKQEEMTEFVVKQIEGMVKNNEGTFITTMKRALNLSST